jgi:hypothetical protein
MYGYDLYEIQNKIDFIKNKFPEIKERIISTINGEMIELNELELAYIKRSENEFNKSLLEDSEKYRTVYLTKFIFLYMELLQKNTFRSYNNLNLSTIKKGDKITIQILITRIQRKSTSYGVTTIFNFETQEHKGSFFSNGKASKILEVGNTYQLNAIFKEKHEEYGLKISRISKVSQIVQELDRNFIVPEDLIAF